MALARHGFTDIRILERAPSAEYYNPGKALAYALFATGKNTLRRLGMTDVDDLGSHLRRALLRPSVVCAHICAQPRYSCSTA